MKNLTMLMAAALTFGVCSVAMPMHVRNVVHISRTDGVQKIHDYKVRGNTVVIVGNPATCPPCRRTDAAINAIHAVYPNVTFVFVSSAQYPSQLMGTSIPELQFYKDGVFVQRVFGGHSAAELRALLNKHYR